MPALGRYRRWMRGDTRTRDLPTDIYAVIIFTRDDPKGRAEFRSVDLRRAEARAEQLIRQGIRAEVKHYRE